MKPTLKDQLVSLFGELLRTDLGAGFDAADLVEAGARPEHVPPFLFIELPALEYEGRPTPAPSQPAAVDEPETAAAADLAAPRGEGRRRRGGDLAGEHAALVAYFDQQLARRDLEPRATDGWRRVSSGILASIKHKELAADIWFDLLAGGGDAALSHVEHVLGVIARRRADIRHEKLIGRLVGRPATAAGQAALAGWVRAVTGSEVDTDVRVMAHWLWLVKRLAAGLSTEWDMMPIVFGTEHGSGKSTATARLVAPLDELATGINASCLTDERKMHQLGVLLVGRWEEMQGAAKSDVEALKNTVTTPTVNYRELTTHHMVVLRRTCSFIGTSNNTVDTMVGDTTGARRFYQLNALPKCDWERLNAIDPALIWEAVSEHDPMPIGSIIHVVREAQASLVHRDAVSFWLDAETWDKLTIRRVDREDPLIVHPYQAGLGCEFEDLAARFKHWCNEVGQSGIGVKELAKRLKQEGFRRWRPGVTAGQRRVWRFLKPGDTERDPLNPTSPTGPNPPAAPGDGRPARGARMAADPSPDEDVLGDGEGGYAFT